MSFQADNLQLENLYVNNVFKQSIEEGLGTHLKAVGIGAILGILAHLTTFSTGRGIPRHTHTSSESHKDVREGVNTIIQLSQCIIDCMNKRASEEYPVSQEEIQKLRDVQFLYSEIKSNTHNISSKDIDTAMTQLKDVVYANGLEDEPRLHRWIGAPEAHSDPYIIR